MELCKCNSERNPVPSEHNALFWFVCFDYLLPGKVPRRGGLRFSHTGRLSLVDVGGGHLEGRLPVAVIKRHLCVQHPFSAPGRRLCRAVVSWGRE